MAEFDTQNTVSAAGAAPEGAAPLAVLLENVVFSWPGQSPTLILPYFSLSSGEMLFMSGPSGCGKSTLLGIIAGILKPDSGAVLVNGTSLQTMGGSRRDIFRGDHIGFIFQQFNLIPYLSVLQNVLIPCNLSAIRRQSASLQAGSPIEAAQDLLRRLDLSPALWNRRASQLSVGQQQRVAAARALIGSPPLLIADEPTSSLDADRRESFLDILLRECTTSGASLIFVSHDSSLSAAFPHSVHLDELNKASPSQET